MIRKLAALLGACLALAGNAADTSSAPLPIDYFAAAPSFRLPKLAADGQSYAIVVSNDATDALVRVDLTTGKSEPVMKSGEARFLNYWWKGRDTLLLLLLWPNGEREFQIFSLTTQKVLQPPALHRFVARLINPLAGDPDHVLIAAPEPNVFDKFDSSAAIYGSFRFNLALQKLDVHTGKAAWLSNDSNHIFHWYADDSGRPVASLGLVKENWFMQLSQPGQSPWRRVDLGDKRWPSFLPAAVAPDQRRLIGIERSAPDTDRVIAWDPVNDSREVLFASPELDADIAETYGDDWTRLLAVRFEDARVQFRYFNPEDQTVADAIDGALPDTTNQLISASADKSRIIVYSESDRIAGAFYLFDRQTNKLRKLGAAHPKAEPTRMAASRYFRCAARDGLTLRGRVYLPAATAAPPPAVVIIDGIRQRSRFGYDPYAQLLASRGYAVVRVDHRGVHGYGEKFAAAGDLESGGKIPDDIVDALQWLAEQKLIDSAKAVVHGIDSGGLIAFQAVARYPDRFAALINFWAPARMDSIPFDEFVCGCYSKEEIKSRFGGDGPQLQYRENLDPLAVMEKSPASMLHYYPRSKFKDRYSNEGDRLASRAEKDSRHHRFLEGASYYERSEFFTNWTAPARDERKRVYAEVLAFLGKNLPVK